jgi:alpha-glucosidase
VAATPSSGRAPDVATPSSGRAPDVATPWWHHAAVYQVYPRSFRDSNGDGTGDLRGVIDGLPYLESLGIDAVWLSPFYPSPQRDSGYDVADPRDVDPMYGTLVDAEELIASAHARGLRIIVDVVPNHSSSDRPWFQEALAAAPGSAARARYHFRDGRGADGAEPPTNWVSWFGGGAWTRITEADGSPGQWYLHQFDTSQPDLNWANPEVVADGLETLRFWLDRGADGFRVDVALGLAKDMTYPDIDDPESLILAMRMDLDDGSPEAAERRARVANSAVLDRDEVQDIYRGWRRVMDEYDRDAMAVAEAWVPVERAARYVAPDTLDQIFNFDFMACPWDADRMRDVIEKTMASLTVTGAPATWALSNHDSPRVVTRLGGGDEGRRRARALAMMAHALPGAVYVYQGEELGLADVDLPDEVRQDPVFLRTNGEQKGRDAARVPIPWSGDHPPYGFGSTADTWLPMPEGWGSSTIAAEETDPDSTLWQYRSMLHLRHALPALRGQGFAIRDAGPGVLVIDRGAGFFCVVNASTEPIDAPVVGDVLVASDPDVMEEGGRITLPPSTGAWIQA